MCKTQDAFFTPYLGHGEAVRIIDPELGTLERENVKEIKAGGMQRRKSISRRESSFGNFILPKKKLGIAPPSKCRATICHFRSGRW